MKQRFATTRWSLVLAARESAADSHAALSELCQIYWYPVYSFVRRRRSVSPEDAHDLAQGFFTALLERRDLERVSPGRGRFRSWLLTALKHFLANDWNHKTAVMRDFRSTISLDAGESERRYSLEPAHNVDPERLYHRNCALVLIDRSLMRLQQERARANKTQLFERVRGLLIGPEGDLPSYAPHAAALGMSVNSLKVEVHRLRNRLGEILREEIAELVETPEEIASEISFLLESLSLPRDPR